MLRLELERYGHFDGKVLDFRRDSCLHVVYGRNEAGKSSCLDAITDLLFSFQHITKYDFMYDKTKLGIGATIEAKDGAQLTFRRRKGTKNTLLDSQGKPLSEDVLLPFLSSVSRSVFLNAFGLSKETLRAGAEEMLKTGGEAGSSLIAAASGLKGLSDLRRKLETEASAIFMPTRSQHRTFYQAKDRQEEAARSIRQLELRDRDLKEKRAYIRSLEEELETLRQQRSHTIQRREFLGRQRDIAPLLMDIAANEDLLNTYKHLPSIEVSQIAQLRGAYERSEMLAAQLQRLKNELTGAVATAQGFIVEAPLIALGPAITALISESGNYTAEKAQLARVQGEADGFSKKLEEYRVRLGLPAEADIAGLRPSDLVIARVKDQIAAGKRLEASRSSQASAMAKEQATHDELAARQASQATAGDPKSVRERLMRLMPVLGRLPEVGRLGRTIAKESEQLRERAAQLAPAVLDLDTVAAMSLPSADTISEHARAVESISKELGAQHSALEEIEKRLPGLRSAVRHLEQDFLESTPERIADARSARTSQWIPLRSILLNEKEPLPVGETAESIVEFEKSIDTSDRLADDAVRNAGRLAARDQEMNRLREEEQQHLRISDLVEAKRAEIAAQEIQWKNLWATHGLVPTAPRKMEGWLSQVGDLLERRSEIRENQRALAELRDGIARVEPALKELALLLGITEADKLPPEVLLAGIQDEIEKRSEAWRKSHEIQTLVTSSESRLEELESDLKSLQNAVRESSKTWAQVMTALNLPVDTTHDQAAAALDVWQQVPSTLAQFDDRSRRVQGMKRDMESFEAHTSALFTQLGELQMGIGADAAIKTIGGRLTKALQTESMASMANQRVKELEAQILIAAANLSSAEATFDALCEGLPPSAQRSEQIAELEAREAIFKTLLQLRHTLAPLSLGKSEAELRAALQTFDAVSAAAEIEELTVRGAQHNQDENERFAALRQAQKELEILQTGTGAEVALQVKKNAEAQLVQCAREWGVKRIAELLLSHAIEQFRSQQEQPLLKRASELFSLLTAANFSGIEQEFDENDNVQLVGRRDAERTVCIDGMSEGTRDQLYLALRLAYLEDYATRTEPMPFIGDDLLTNFDDERTQKGIAALAAVGEHIQPILFTHHRRVVDLAQRELGSTVDVISLDDRVYSAQPV
jgi:uncharacterized protein YhaN